MKKAALILIMVIIMLNAIQMCAWADDLAIMIDNGDRVSIFEDVVVDKETNGDVVAIFGNIDVNKKVQGDVVAIFGDVDINDSIDGEVVAILGNINLDQRVSGEIVSAFGKVTMSKNAVVNGDLIVIGSIDREAGAKVFGQEVKVNTGFLMVARVVVTIVLAFLVLVLGLVAISIFRERSVNISDGSDKNTGRKIAVGFLGFIGFFIIMVLLSIVVVGPIIHLFLLIIAEIAVSICAGKQILKLFNANQNVYLEFTTGLAVISFIKIVLTLIIPQIGFVAYLLLYIAIDIFIRSWGIGILIDTRFGTDKKYTFTNNFNNQGFELDKNSIRMEGNDDEK